MHKKQLPLYAAYVMDNHGKLFSAALRQFGSWAKALVAAGIRTHAQKSCIKAEQVYSMR
jgi:hypothetical protein